MMKNLPKIFIYSSIPLAVFAGVVLGSNWSSSTDKLARSTVESAREPRKDVVFLKYSDFKVAADQTTAAKQTTLSQRFVQMTSNKDPLDAMQAYNLAMGCIWAQEAQKSAELQAPGERTAETSAALQDGSLSKNTKTACGDLTQQQLKSRVQFLTIAAEAGVPMAAIRLSAEGPWGDPSALTSRSNDPAVMEWRQRIADLIRLAASKGDTSSLLSLSNMYANGSGVIGERDPAKALQYATAMWDLRARYTGKISPLATQQSDRLSTPLTSEQAKQAIEAGHQLALASVSEATK